MLTKTFLSLLRLNPPNKSLLSTTRYLSLDIKEHDISPNLQEKILKVAIVGTPNAGKSTFINDMIDRKVCATSSKVHTTRKKSSSIFTEGESQIVFLDTPGLVNIKEYKKYNLERSFIKDSKHCLQEADMIGVIHDVSNIHTRDRLDLKLFYLLEDHKDKPSFLVLNKIDLLKSKRKLLDITRLLTDNCVNGKIIPNSKNVKLADGTKAWKNFSEVFMVSALTGSGIDDIKDYLVKQSKPGKWLYPADVWSDQSPEQIILDAVKAKFLDFLQQELPYQLKPEMEFFEVDQNGVIKTVVLVNCPTQRHRNLIAGGSDGRLKQITESIQNDLQNAFQNIVRIKIILQAPDEK